MTSPDDSTSASTITSRRWLWFSLKWLLFAAVLFFVGRRVQLLWQQQGELSAVSVKPVWLILAAALYAIGWLPSVWFWRKLMVQMGGRVTYRDAARAYYCGHLGKYIPGKAMVLVIRSAMVKGNTISAAAAAVTAIVETMLMMGAGLAVAVALAPLLLSDTLIQDWPEWIRHYVMQPGVTAALTLAVLLISLPVLARILTLIAKRMTPRSLNDGSVEARITPRTVAAGIAAFVVSWACHGLSLGFTLRAVSSAPLDLSSWPVWTGAVAAATAIGFAVLFAPGGMGVREGLLIECLRIQPDIEPQAAVIAAVFLRVVWFSTEIGIAGVLYFAFPPPRIDAKGVESGSR